MTISKNLVFCVCVLCRVLFEHLVLKFTSHYRTNFIESHTSRRLRIIGLSTALANAKDLANWLNIGELGLYNFRPSVRPVPLEVRPIMLYIYIIQGYIKIWTFGFQVFINFGFLPNHLQYSSTKANKTKVYPNQLSYFRIFETRNEWQLIFINKQTDLQ